MSFERRQLALVAAAGMVLSLSAGCGKKGTPHPPPKLIPAQISDLVVQQRGDELVLRMSYPTTTMGGLALQGIEALEMLRFDMPIPEGQEDEPPTITGQIFDQAARVVGRWERDEVAAQTAGGSIVVRVPAFSSEERSVSGLAARTFGPRGHASPPSNLAAILPEQPPQPPTSVTIEATADGVVLRWTAPAAELEGFNIYRRGAGGLFSTQPLGNAEAESYLDSTADFGQLHTYVVTSVSSRQPMIESTSTEEVAIDYADGFPPETPTGLAALPEQGRIRLLWNRVEAEDLEGYFVYRRTEQSGAARLAEDAASSTETVDEGGERGVSYLYSVTAIDHNGNESPPSEEVTAVSR